MRLQSCLVTCKDNAGVNHSVEVSADSLYQAVGLGLAALQANGWVGEIHERFTTITVTVRPPAVTHTVRAKQFFDWLDSAGGKGPRDLLLKNSLRKRLGREDAPR